jgi:hypothetical protein
MLKQSIKRILSPWYPLTNCIEQRFRWLNSKLENPGNPLTVLTTLPEIVQRSLTFIEQLRVTSRDGHFIGYRHSPSTTRPVLYATVSAHLFKHLCNSQDPRIPEELEYVLHFQDEDGLFRDPAIACPLADTEDWWGWRHLTLHVLMMLALYNKPALRPITYLKQFTDKDRWRSFLHSCDWGKKVDYTSNQLQNLGVMLQYSRDYQNDSQAQGLLDVLFDVLNHFQDQNTGLYGHSVDTPQDLSTGVQAGYHFWLLYFYDHRPINHMESIIDHVLTTQNILGGYGTKWNSSACEDIDSIDPLLRFSRLTDYRKSDILLSLRKALPAVLNNLNQDGGWVFRRHESLQIVHPQMYSHINQSNLFYTWFRTLGLAYCLTGMGMESEKFSYPWNFKRAPGHQFLL